MKKNWLCLQLARKLIKLFQFTYITQWHHCTINLSHDIIWLALWSDTCDNNQQIQCKVRPLFLKGSGYRQFPKNSWTERTAEKTIVQGGTWKKKKKTTNLTSAFYKCLCLTFFKNKIAEAIVTYQPQKTTTHNFKVRHFPENCSTPFLSLKKIGIRP